MWLQTRKRVLIIFLNLWDDDDDSGLLQNLSDGHNKFYCKSHSTGGEILLKRNISL